MLDAWNFSVFFASTVLALSLAQDMPVDEHSFIQVGWAVGEGVGERDQVKPHHGMEQDPFRSFNTLLGRPDRKGSDIVGVRANKRGDEEAFASSLYVSISVVFIFALVFYFMRRRVPLIYENNILTGSAPVPDDATWGILQYSLKLSQDDITEAAGLDATMLLEYSSFCVLTMTLIGIPIIFILCPLHFFFGRAEAADWLDQFGVANMENGSVLCWLHSVTVWYVVVVVIHLLERYNKNFLEARYRWFLEMPAPRATTLMFEHIPWEHCSDAALRDFVQERFPNQRVKEVAMVKHTRSLVKLLDELRNLHSRSEEAEFALKRHGGETNQARVDDLARQVHNAEELVNAERGRLLRAAERPISEQLMEGSHGVYSQAAFVTFEDRNAAEAVLLQSYSEDPVDIVVSMSPDPTDVMYSHLTVDPYLQNFLTVLGQICIVLLFFTWMPLISAVSTITSVDTLKRVRPIEVIFARYPSVESASSGLMASAVLTLFMSFLPSLLMLIFNKFFKLKAHQWAQHKLQNVYFWFQVVFTILVTAVGSSLWDSLEDVIMQPTSIFGLLADSMPSASHFYLSFIVMQWSTEALNITRYIPLLKYCFYSCFMSPDDARNRAEPEDQDYYGMGGRTARFSLNMAIGLVFCCLSPAITILVCINFIICRVVYGYLLVYAETRKPDLGGAFWKTQMRHIFVGLVIYVMLMYGIVSRKAAHWGPVVLMTPILVWLFFKFRVFVVESEWDWQSMSHKDMSVAPPAKTSHDTYVQKELIHVGDTCTLLAQPL